MDATALARSLLEPVPAHRTAGIQVLRAADCAAEVALDTPYGLTGVIGGPHSSALIALLDAAGPAAVVAAVGAPGEFDGVVPLGAAATVEFLAPARGRLVASCALGESARRALREVLSGAATGRGRRRSPRSGTRRAPWCAAAASTGASAGSAAPDGKRPANI
ncbi:hypothetical protein ACH5AL_04175 [Actinacidiphila glaucinigra]|uniref:hypothetical protein n=1 Tax=Actinacidiphila glaucinigra TaxID=235986 RepID=UPI0037A1D074